MLDFLEGDEARLRPKQQSQPRAAVLSQRFPHIASLVKHPKRLPADLPHCCPTCISAALQTEQTMASAVQFGRLATSLGRSGLLVRSPATKPVSRIPASRTIVVASSRSKNKTLPGGCTALLSRASIKNPTHPALRPPVLTPCLPPCNSGRSGRGSERQPERRGRPRPRQRRG